MYIYSVWVWVGVGVVVCMRACVRACGWVGGGGVGGACVRVCGGVGVGGILL